MFSETVDTCTKLQTVPLSLSVPHQAEELIKQEMLVMLRHDLVHHPPQSSSKSKANLAVVKGDLEKNPLESFTEEELKNVCVCTCICMYIVCTCTVYSVHVHVCLSNTV